MNFLIRFFQCSIKDHDVQEQSLYYALYVQVYGVGTVFLHQIVKMRKCRNEITYKKPLGQKKNMPYKVEGGARGLIVCCFFSALKDSCVEDDFSNPGELNYILR